MVSDPREDLFALLEGALAEGVFPGCVALVIRDGAVVYHEAHGSLASHPPVPVTGEPVRRATVYDLASLTKVLATTTLAAIGASEGWFDLDAEVPSPWRRACPGASARDLLEHCSGLPAHREFFADVEPFDRDGVLTRVSKTAPEYALRSRAVYSDLGFMVLGAWLERAADVELANLFRDRVAYALGLDGATPPAVGFRKLTGGLGIALHEERQIAPTETYDRSLHRTELPSHFSLREVSAVAHGEVHDDNAFVMGGVAGHAGLFGTAHAVQEIARAWLENNVPGLTKAVRDRFWQASAVPGSVRRVGFDGPEPDGRGSTAAALSPRAVGHTGYTGTSLWIDPGPPSRVIVLLSNAVHPIRRPEIIREFRPRFHIAASRL